MGETTVGWVAVLVGVGPYATAIVALLGAFLSSWLVQRNWAKQFAAQRSAAIEERRLDLLENVTAKLFEAGQHQLQALLFHRLQEALQLLGSSGREFSKKRIEAQRKAQITAVEKFKESMFEFSRLIPLMYAFFGEDVIEALGGPMGVIQGLFEAPEAAPLTREAILRIVPEGGGQEEVITALTAVLMKQFHPLNDQIGTKIGALGQRMLVEMKRSSTSQSGA